MNNSNTHDKFIQFGFIELLKNGEHLFDFVVEFVLKNGRQSIVCWVCTLWKLLVDVK